MAMRFLNKQTLQSLQIKLAKVEGPMERHLMQSFCTKVSNSKPGSSNTSTPTASKAAPAVEYKSDATPLPPNSPVGPGALKDGEYKNTEYYSYDAMSYFDLEVEMKNDRLPQPKSGNELY